jgi:hypothetical protein
MADAQWTTASHAQARPDNTRRGKKHAMHAELAVLQLCHWLYLVFGGERVEQPRRCAGPACADPYGIENGQFDWLSRRRGILCRCVHICACSGDDSA